MKKYLTLLALAIPSLAFGQLNFVFEPEIDTSAELAGIVTDETGSGALVFGTSPTLVTPALGTPSAIVLTNASGAPTLSGLTLTGSLVSDLDTGLTAGTTQTQGGGLALTAQINDVTTVANQDDTVVLAGFAAGSLQIVYNNGANRLQVFPASGDDLGEGSDTATTIQVGQFGVFRGISTSAANSSIGTPSPVIQKHATSHTLSAEECFNGSVYYITASGVTLTLPAAEDGMSITVICTTANVGIVDSNASDLIILDGTTLDDGDSIDSPGAAGDVVVLTYYDATGWFASSNTWVDGGAS